MFQKSLYRRILVFVVSSLLILVSFSSVYAGYDVSFNSNICSSSENKNIQNQDEGFNEKKLHLLLDKYDLDEKCRQRILERPYNFRKTSLIDSEEWDIVVPDHYQTIQEAIDHAYEYCTILVRSGVYHENVIVDVNALQIIGENLINTVIDGSESGIVIEIKAFLVSISGFNITNGEVGLSFGGFSPTFNSINGNEFYKNQIGIEIKGLERSNVIYHNSFIDNILNAYDPTENTFWYDAEIKEGNYWYDYKGVDYDGDGIGDMPYDISGNRTQDKYPLMKPYYFNFRPDKPSKPIGTSHGKTCTEYTYITNSNDPEDEKLFYWFDWGDGTNSTWSGPYESGEECNVSHIWFDEGTYEIRVKAKNKLGVESVWSDPLSISMPKSKTSNTSFLNFLEKHTSMFPLLRQLLKL